MSAIVVSYDSLECVVAINGVRYSYVSSTYTGTALADKFKGIAKYSEGKALAWIKKNANGVKIG